jgi:hypothetical protein
MLREKEDWEWTAWLQLLMPWVLGVQPDQWDSLVPLPSWKAKDFLPFMLQAGWLAMKMKRICIKVQGSLHFWPFHVWNTHEKVTPSCTSPAWSQVYTFWIRFPTAQDACPKISSLCPTQIFTFTFPSSIGKTLHVLCSLNQIPGHWSSLPSTQKKAFDICSELGRHPTATQIPFHVIDASVLTVKAGVNIEQHHLGLYMALSVSTSSAQCWKTLPKSTASSPP